MAPPTRSRLTPRGVLNRRAVAKYAEFWVALQAVGDALAQVEKVGAKAQDAEKARASAGVAGRSWSVASPEEIKGAAKKAHRTLRVIATSAKRWEADLLAREWRA
jgi:hypothetical protein